MPHHFVQEDILLAKVIVNLVVLAEVVRDIATDLHDQEVVDLENNN